MKQVIIAELEQARTRKFLWDFGGQRFMDHRIAQYPMDLSMWERFLNSISDIKSIVELGTANCGMALFLALQAYQHGMEFRTFDWKEGENLDTPLSKLLCLRDKFILGDLWGDSLDILTNLLMNEFSHPILLFCDDGVTGKEDEFRDFVPLLQVGDYVAVHDWPYNISEGDIGFFGDALERLWWEQWEVVGSITRFMRVVKPLDDYRNILVNG